MTHPAVTTAKPCHRSRISNGSEMLAGIDGRSAQARRYRDIVASLLGEMGPVGVAENLQVRAAASMQLQAEALTAAMVRGEVVDQEQLSRAANGAIRALAAIRKCTPAKPKGPNLAEYLASKQAAA